VGGGTPGPRAAGRAPRDGKPVKDIELTGSDIAQAYMQAGLSVAMELDPALTYRFDGFAEPVQELTRRCLATCHPGFNRS
jgi:hypothetical protein